MNEVYVMFNHIAQGCSPKFKDKIVIKGNTTMLIGASGRVLSKVTCEKGEKFDKEKGVLLCLAKACGFTTTRIYDLINSAIVQKTDKAKIKATVRKRERDVLTKAVKNGNKH